MKNNRQLVICFCAMILVIVFPLMITACGPMGPDDLEAWIDGHEHDKEDHEYNYMRREINYLLACCTGEGFLKKGLAVSLMKFDDIENKYGGQVLQEGYPPAPHFVLEVPENYKSTENTRYNIELLEKDKQDFYKGLKVTAYEIEPEKTNSSDVGGWSDNDINGSNPTGETTGAISGLSIDEITGTYPVYTTLETRMRGKDEDEDWRVIDEQEVMFTFVITALDANTIRIEMDGLKCGEGFYDPVSCSCEFKLAQEWREAWAEVSSNSTDILTDDRIRRITFSKVDGDIQFTMITVGEEDKEPTVGIKKVD